MSDTRSACTARGPKPAPISEKRRVLKAKARKKRASGTSRSHPSITSVTLARLEQLKKASTTKKAQASPAPRPSSKTLQKSAVFRAALSFPADAVPAAFADQDILRASARQSANVALSLSPFRR